MIRQGQYISFPPWVCSSSYPHPSHGLIRLAFYWPTQPQGRPQEEQEQRKLELEVELKLGLKMELKLELKLLL
jgi:hypothetical protein